MAVLVIPVGAGRGQAAGDCGCTGLDYERDLAVADVVFDGKATQRSEPSTTLTTWRFEVSNVVKGSAAAVQDVSTPPLDGCPASFEIGTAYRVFARRDGGFLVTAHCRGNRVLTGYRLAAADGGVFAFGASSFHGSAGGIPLAAPVVGIAATPSGRGYWLAAADGGVFGFGDARFFGSAAGLPVSWPVADIAATGSGAGYWLLGIDGGVFAYGDARFFGVPDFHARNQSGIVLQATGIAASHGGSGYLISSEQGLAFGFDDTGPFPILLIGFSDVVGISRTSGSAQFVIAGSPGWVFIYVEQNFGDLRSKRLNAPVVAVSA